MTDSVTLPRKKAPVETRNLSKTAESSCKKKTTVGRRGYQDPGSNRALAERAARGPRNPLERAMMSFTDRLPPGISRGASKIVSGFGDFMQRFFGGGGAGGDSGLRSGRRL